MKFETNTNIEDQDLESIIAILESSVYSATRIFEDLEDVGRIFGNGHHVRQKIAQFAVQELRKRFRK